MELIFPMDHSPAQFIVDDALREWLDVHPLLGELAAQVGWEGSTADLVSLAVTPDNGELVEGAPLPQPYRDRQQQRAGRP